MYLYATGNSQKNTTISHKFLVTGHKQNEGDIVHSTIEQQKTRALKSGPIFVPSQMITIVQTSKKTGQPYIVKPMTTNNFLNMKKLADEIGKNYNTDENGEKVLWQKIKVIKVDRDYPYIIFFKTSYHEECRKLNVRQQQIGKPLPMDGLNISKAYQEWPKITTIKKKDLLSSAPLNIVNFIMIFLLLFQVMFKN